MALLSKILDEVRARHRESAARELGQILDLGAELQALDRRLLDAADDLMADIEERRALVHRKLLDIARCAGLVPSMPAPTAATEPPQLEAGTTPLPSMFERERERQRALAGASAAHPQPHANGHYQTSPAGVQ